MHHEQEIEKDPQEKDIFFDWVNSSRFLFYLQMFCMIAFILGGCYMLSKKSYQGHPDVQVPENTLYTPKYK